MAETANASPLVSWIEGAAKSQILDFVARVTRQGGQDFVPPADRIAAFDNDGTLWCEQPMQVQVFFLISRVRELAERDATVKERQPFKALLELDFKTLMGLGKQALLELVFATHSGMTEEEFDPIAREWLAKSKHPKFGRQDACGTLRDLHVLASGRGGLPARTVRHRCKKTQGVEREILRSRPAPLDPRPLRLNRSVADMSGWLSPISPTRLVSLPIQMNPVARTCRRSVRPRSRNRSFADLSSHLRWHCGRTSA
jgi:hypothetical protein